MIGLLKRVAMLAAIAGVAPAMTTLPRTPAPAAAASATAAPPAATAAAPALTATDLAAFFDGLIPYALRRSDIAGGVVVVVKDGQVVFEHGYGYADLARHAPVSPANTLFRPGSISKLFTWTAVMQLVGEGKLNLDRDVNAYLDFHIPAWHGKPITLRELMTHTAGFEDVNRGLMPASPRGLGLRRYLKRELPRRIFPPGALVAYSNYGCGLAGYIVQRVSGEPFDQYVQRHIFKPLGMDHSTFRQPLPPALAPLMSRGYRTASADSPQPFELVNPAPAGAMTTTAQDMARFMIAQLQDGRYGSARILQPATARLMHSPQYAPAPDMPGFDLGFYQEDRNGLRIIGHAGDTMLFHSDLHLLLGKDVGLFVSFNSRGGPGALATLSLRRAIFHAFLDRYFPAPLPAPSSPPPSARKDAVRVAGWYQSTRRNDSALRLFNLLSQYHVAATADGGLTVSPLLDDLAGKPLHWRETEPLHYRQAHGRDRLRFVTDATGHVRYWTTTYIPAVMLFQRVPAARSKGTVLPLLGLSMLIVLLALLGWGPGHWLRQHYGAPLVLPSPQRRWRLLSRLGALLLCADVTGWLLLAAAIGTHPALLLQGGAAVWMELLYVLGVLTLIGVVAVVWHTANGWWHRERRLGVRLGDTALACAALYLGWFILAFGLVSFNTHF